ETGFEDADQGRKLRSQAARATFGRYFLFDWRRSRARSWRRRSLCVPGTAFHTRSEMQRASGQPMLRSVESLWPVAGQTAVIYLCLVVAMRLVGRRQLGQFTVLDLVIILVMGSAVETAMIHGDTSLRAGLV